MQPACPEANVDGNRLLQRNTILLAHVGPKEEERIAARFNETCLARCLQLGQLLRNTNTVALWIPGRHEFKRFHHATKQAQHEPALTMSTILNVFPEDCLK